MSEPNQIAELDRFGHDEAWWLGSALVDRCRSENLAVTILIQIGQQRVFHAAMPGTSADNDSWAERKARVVSHFALSSLEVFERYVEGNPEFCRLFALPLDHYAPFGGAVPIKVGGLQIGTLAVSGLDSAEDHQLAVDALRDEAAFQAEGDTRPGTGEENAGPDLATYRALQSGQHAQVWIGGADLAEPELLLETSQMLIEAPNWSTDGTSLFVNGNGQLWRIDLEADQPELAAVSFSELPPINNDHVLAPDGRHIYLSAMDGHIYRGPLTGGTVERVTTGEGVWHFLHGVSPDGTALAYVRMTDFTEPGQLAVLNLTTGTSGILDTGDGHLDGPEWSPDGARIYVNTESFTNRPGHAQLASLPAGGGPLLRLTESSTVDWFPHLSPNGQHATYLSFPAGTLGHPANLDVTITVVATNDWTTPLQTYPLLGGQGTLNVNSWAPDSRRFAFVTYPTV